MTNDPRNAWQAQPLPPSPYPPQAPYGPPPGYPPAYSVQAQRSDNEATTIFVLGLLGLVMCQILAPIAWAKGSSYRTTCRVTETTPNALATTGWVLGIVGTVMLGLSLLFVVASFALSAAH